MDQFIDFLEKTKRNFSVKIHKTVDLKKIKHDNSSKKKKLKKINSIWAITFHLLGSSLDLRDKVHDFIHHDARSIETPTESTADETKSAKENKFAQPQQEEAAQPEITTSSPTTPLPTAAKPAAPVKQVSTNHLMVPEEKEQKEDPNDIFIELNDNVYLQIQYIKLSIEHKPKQRRALFL